MGWAHFGQQPRRVIAGDREGQLALEVITVLGIGGNSSVVAEEDAAGLSDCVYYIWFLRCPDHSA